MQEIPESVRAAVEALDQELTGEAVRKVAVAGRETVN
jgi:hypothetical protein